MSTSIQARPRLRLTSKCAASTSSSFNRCSKTVLLTAAGFDAAAATAGSSDAKTPRTSPTLKTFCFAFIFPSSIRFELLIEELGSGTYPARAIRRLLAVRRRNATRCGRGRQAGRSTQADRPRVSGAAIRAAQMRGAVGPARGAYEAVREHARGTATKQVGCAVVFNTASAADGRILGDPGREAQAAPSLQNGRLWA